MRKFLPSPFLVPENEGQVFWRRLILFSLIFLIVLGGFGIAHWRAERSSQQMRQILLSQVTAIASNISPVSLQNLSFTAEDVNNIYFQRLRGQMQAYGKTFGHLSIYTMVLRDGKIIFGPESLNSMDSLSSPPGTEYQRPPEGLLKLFSEPQSLTLGPYSDEYGQFFSGYAPIFKPRTDQVLAIVAMDIKTARWRGALRKKIWLPLGFSLLLIFLTLGADYLIKSRQRLNNPPMTNQAESIATAIIGVALTLGLAGLLQENEFFIDQRNFNQIATGRASIFADKLWDMQNYGLANLTRFLAMNENTSWEEFKRFTLPMSQETSIQAWEWIPRVEAGDRQQFEEQARAEGLTNFRIFQVDGQNGIFPATGDGPHYVILYAEPLEGNEMALGFDITSNPPSQGPLAKALETGMPAVTGPVTLIQETEEQQGLVIYSPVFPDPNGPASGVAAVVIRLEEFLRETFVQTSYGDESLELEWLQLSANEAPRSLANSSPRSFTIDSWQAGQLENNQQPFLKVYPVFVFGRAYALLLWPGKSFQTGYTHQVALVTLGVGTAITILVTIIVAIVTNSRANLTSQVRQRTSELRVTLRELQERIKEMDCLVAIAQMSQKPDLALEQFLQKSVELLPLAFRYEKLASARLTWGNSIYQTINYKNSDWCLAVEFQTEHFHQGRLEVCYGQERQFLPQEEGLINTVAQFLSRFLESHYTEVVLERSERNYREIFNSTQEAIFIQDGKTGTILDVNKPMLKMYGYENKEEIIGQSVAILISYKPGQTQAEIEKKFLRVKDSGPQVFEWLAKRQDGSVFWTEVSLRATEIDNKIRLLAVGRDISTRKQNEQRIEYLTRLYATLSQVNRAIIEHRDRDGLFQAICDVGVEVGKFSLIWFGLIDPETQRIIPYISGGQTSAYLDNIQITTLDEPAGRGPAGNAAREGCLVICSDILQDPKMVPWRSSAVRYGFQSCAAVPIKQGRQVVGVLTIYSQEVGFFSEDEQGLLQEIGDNISFALDAIHSDQDNHLAQRKLGENEERLRLALEAGNQGFYDLNLQTGSAVVSPHYAQILGYDWENFQETHQRWLERIHPQDQERVEEIYQDYIRGKINRYQVECRQRTTAGEWKWLLSLGKIVEWDGLGQPLRMLGTLTDITERKQAEAQIENLAYYDPLTALPNRRLLLDRAENALALAKRSGHYGAVILIDLDGFKTLNDARGHDSGDRLLQMVAQRLGDCLRDSDTVARLGGDEFIILLSELADDLEMAARLGLNVGEKIRQALATVFVLEMEEVQISGSIGITLFPKVNETVSDLFKEADTAMYQAKKAGRDKVCLFESQMQLEVESRFALEADMRHALEQKQFQVYLQPQVDQNGLWIGAEALLRWHHPTRGFIPPNIFIPIAEETGLICAIGDFVLEEACSYLARLQQMGSNLRIAVNISPRQFRQPHLVAETKALLSRIGVAPYRLTLEVTEGLIVEDTHQAIATMFELQTLGIHFSVDDFGTGYSSLAYLKRLPLNELKIDRAFVQDAPTDLNNAALVEAIISVARTFNLAIVAEGVETQEQADFLAQRGCNLYQGYFFGRPMPIEEFHAQLKIK